MPLDTDKETRVGQFDALDQAVAGASRDHQPRRNVAYRLVVHTVDLWCRVAHRFYQMGRGRDHDLVRKMASRELAPQIVIGARVRRVFSRDIAVEGSTEGNVQHLAAPADTEGRLVVGSSPADNVD